MHPLHTEGMLASWARMNPHYDPRRRTGRTTARALSYLAEALRDPGVPVRVHDHHDGRVADDHLLRMMHDIVYRLEWKGYKFNPARVTVTFGEPR